MPVIKGKATKVGHVKEYRYGRKFFLEVDTPDLGLVKAMVDEKHERPFSGDDVQFDADIKNGWASVTEKRHFEIISREGRGEWEKKKQEWIADKKSERDVNWQASQYDRNVVKEVNKEYGSLLNKELNLKKSPTVGIIATKVLKFLEKYRTSTEGIGGESMSLEGVYGYPGTGMRSPKGPLYNQPQSVRTSALQEGLRAGLWSYNEGSHEYKLTELGKAFANRVDEFEKEKNRMEYVTRGRSLGYKEALDAKRKNPNVDSHELYHTIKREMDAGKNTGSELYAKFFDLNYKVKDLVGCKRVHVDGYDRQLSGSHECTPEQQQKVDRIINDFFDSVNRGIKEALK